MGKSSFKEKRMFDRVSCSNKGKYELNDISSGTFTCKNISPKGVGVHTLEALPIDTKVKIEISTKNNSPLLLEGKVRWCTKEADGYMVGIEFSEPLFILLSMILEK